MCKKNDRILQAVNLNWDVRIIKKMNSKLKNSYLPEISSLLFGRSIPCMVTVNLTDKCDQQCIYCEIGKNTPAANPRALRTEDLFWIIDQMAIHKISKIALCGGEPFLFDGFFDVIEYAMKKKIRISVTTNGMQVFKLNKTELNVLKESKTEINVSVDSFHESIQNFTRGATGALSNALRSIKILTENDIPVTILSAISKYNYSDISNIVLQAYELGIKQVLFQPIIYFSNYPDRPAIENKAQLNVGVEQIEDLMKELHKILMFERKHAIKTNVYRILPWIKSYLQVAHSRNGKWFFNDVLNEFYCREIYAIIDIACDGGIQPCGLALAKTNIFENRGLGLLELWSNATEKIKDDLSHKRYYNICNGCCHHFSRNMLASIMKFPFKNRVAIKNLLPFVFLRIQSRIINNLKGIK